MGKEGKQGRGPCGLICRSLVGYSGGLRTAFGGACFEEGVGRRDTAGSEEGGKNKGGEGNKSYMVEKITRSE